MSDTNTFVDREQQFRSWVEEYRTELIRICIIHLSDYNLAEDAVQETFMKAWKGLNKFEGRNGCSPKTWLIAIEINTCKSYRRTRWFRMSAGANGHEQLPSHFANMQPEEQDLLIDISNLPEKYKSVILLYYYQRMTQNEIADALGISRSLVNYRLQKALDMLRITLGEEEHNEDH